MTLETEAYEGELKKLRLFYMTVKHNALAEHLEGVYFICGESGQKDKNSLPERIHICPSYGVDWFQIYERTDQSHGPEW